MNKKQRLELLIKHYGEGNKSSFARLLGVSPQAISSWLTRENYDIELIYAKCVTISAEWLLTGEGEMLKSEADERPSAEPTIIYKSDPRDTEMIELQRFKIKELERQLSAAGVKSGFAQSAGLHSFGPPPKKR